MAILRCGGNSVVVVVVVAVVVVNMSLLWLLRFRGGDCAAYLTKFNKITIQGKCQDRRRQEQEQYVYLSPN